MGVGVDACSVNKIVWAQKTGIIFHSSLLLLQSQGQELC